MDSRLDLCLWGAGRFLLSPFSRGKGQTQQVVWGLLHDTTASWSLHTQEIEGVNSVLKHAATLSPNIYFRLLPARNTSKKLIKSCKPREARNELLEECGYFFHHALCQPGPLEFLYVGRASGGRGPKQQFDACRLALSTTHKFSQAALRWLA